MTPGRAGVASSEEGVYGGGVRNNPEAILEMERLRGQDWVSWAREREVEMRGE